MVAYSENLEIMEALEPTVGRLMAEHEERRKHWYFHDLVPWERGRSFRDLPWEESQCTISETARTSLLVNLLTEDNLPYYHVALDKYLPETSTWKTWGGIWTAEEGQHGTAIRSYLLTSRNCDPFELEDSRMATMKNGWEPSWRHPGELFAYTSLQELATRISHRNAGKITDDPAAFELMRHIAADENHHFVFYKGVMKAMLDVAPALALEGLYEALNNFQMPGVAIPGFFRRSVEMARAGVYSLRIHHDRVVKPVLEQWAIADLPAVGAKAAEFQELCLALPAKLAERAERFEKRFPAHA